MKVAIEKELKLAGLQNIDITVTKIIQLFETKNSRHSVMIVGLSGSGKSVSWKMLRNTLTRLRKENKGSQYQAVKVNNLSIKIIRMLDLCSFRGLKFLLSLRTNCTAWEMRIAERFNNQNFSCSF